MYKREERLWPGGCGLFPSRFFREKVSWATLPGKLGKGKDDDRHTG